MVLLPRRETSASVLQKKHRNRLSEKWRNKEEVWRYQERIKRMDFKIIWSQTARLDLRDIVLIKVLPNIHTCLLFVVKLNNVTIVVLFKTL